MSSPEGVSFAHDLNSALADPELARFLLEAEAAEAPVEGAQLAPLLATTPAESLIRLLEQSKTAVTQETLPDYSDNLATKVNTLTQDPSYQHVVTQLQDLLSRGDIASLIDVNEAIRNSPLLRPGSRGISNFAAAFITAVGAAVVFAGSAIACIPLAVGCAAVAVGSAIVFAGAAIVAFNEASNSAGYEFQIDNIGCAGNDCSAGGLATGPSTVNAVHGFCEFKVSDGSIYSSSSGVCNSTQFAYTTGGPVYNGRASVSDRDTVGCYKTFTTEIFIYWSNNTYSKDTKTIAKTTTSSCL